MRLKIGTLGTMEAAFVDLKVKGERMIATMEVTEGLRWEVVSELSYGEIWGIVKAAVRPSILWYMLSAWSRKENEP